MKAESNIGGLLGKSARLLSNKFNSDLVHLGITVEQWTLLATLWTKDHQNQKALQVSLLKDKASINSLLKYLIQGGFVSKVQDKQDKRSYIVSLTDKGREIQKSSIPIAMQNIGIATEGIEAKDLAICVEVLTQIILNLTKENK